MEEMEEIKNRNHVASRKKDADAAGTTISEFLLDELSQPFMELRVNKTRSGWVATLLDTYNCDSIEIICCLTYGAMMSAIS